MITDHIIKLGPSQGAQKLVFMAGNAISDPPYYNSAFDATEPKVSLHYSSTFQGIRAYSLWVVPKRPADASACLLTSKDDSYINLTSQMGYASSPNCIPRDDLNEYRTFWGHCLRRPKVQMQQR